MSESAQGTGKMSAAGGAKQVDISTVINPTIASAPPLETAATEEIKTPDTKVANVGNLKPAKSVDDASNPNSDGNNQIAPDAADAGVLKTPDAPTVKDLSDDELKALYEARFKPAGELSPEQIAEREKATEKRLRKLK